MSTVLAEAQPSVEGLAACLIRDARRAAGLTQSELGQRSGLPQSVISLYENGQRQPTLPSLYKILTATGCHLTFTAEPANEPQVEESEEIQTREEPEEVETATLRARIEDHLRSQGFHIRNGRLIAPVIQGKDELRALHSESVSAQRERSRGALSRHESQFLERLASGAEIQPEEISPTLVPIHDRRSFDGLLFRWCALHWSIPVSSGYGRRLRFLVVDRGHDNKVIGLIGLGDPVFAMAARDAAIGWTREQRMEKLSCVLDAFVLGAVPPYSDLRGGKLAALLATSTEIQDLFAEKYGGRTSLISQRQTEARLAAITTTSALGRSSVYNRLALPTGERAFRSVGYTSGTGDFHFSGAIYADLAAYAQKVSGTATQRHERWTGRTFRNRREVIQRALDALGFDSRQLRIHGVRREAFIAPLASNAFEWLRGEDSCLERAGLNVDALGEWWRDRWAISRAQRTPDWRDFDPDNWRIYT